MNEIKVEKSYLNDAQALAYLVHPWSYFGILGRGTGKSLRILPMRAMRLSYEMPGASFCFYGDTYINLMSNLIPKVLKGWNEMGYYEDIHYVIEKEPPKHFKKPLTRILDYKHTITHCEGTRFKLISEDRPQTARGESFQHVFGDEVKLIKFEKMAPAVFPAIRGEKLLFGKIPQFQGFTFTTDRPELENGKWLLEKEDLMDKDQIKKIIIISLEVEKLKHQLLYANTEGKRKVIQYYMNDYLQGLDKIRNKSVYFATASTFVNVDALGLDSISNMLISLGWNEFKQSVLNIQTESPENMFYAGFLSKHLDTQINYDYYDGFGLNAHIEQNSMGDKDCNAELPLDGGLDFGNMNSLIVCQDKGREFRALKFLYTLNPPEILKDLAIKFAKYYKYHKNKTLNLYYDRSGNNRRNERTTLAEEFKKCLEELNQGWRVNLMSRGWANVPHDTRRLLWEIIFSEKDSRFPIFRMNEVNCKELKASMQLAPTKKNSKGEMEKDKRSEHKALNKLPFESTNPSDSIDYPVWGKYSHLLKSNNKYLSLTPSIKK